MRSTTAVRPLSTLHPAIARALWQWCLVGTLSLILLPSPVHPLFGSLWFWGLMAPLVCLLTLHRHAVLTPRPALFGRRRRGPQARRRVVTGHCLQQRVA